MYHFLVATLDFASKDISFLEDFCVQILHFYLAILHFYLEARHSCFEVRFGVIAGFGACTCRVVSVFALRI